eukprot:1147236-Pelagomonas_calceolata.AAC.3
MGVKFASKFNGTSVIKSQLVNLVKGTLSVTAPTNIQKDDLQAAAVPSPTFAQSYYLHSILFLSSIVLLIRIQLMGLLSTGSYVGPMWGAVPAT